MVERIESVSPRGKLKYIDRRSISIRLLKDFYKCTSCGLCELICQYKLKLTKIWEEKREKLVSSGKYLPAHKKIADITLFYGNPYGESQDMRTSLKSESGTLYFVGCMSSFKVKSIAESAMKVLKLLGIEFTTLGKDEICCGSTMIRTGFKEVAEKLFIKNVRNWQKMRVERIITSCPGCYRTIKKDYPIFAERKEIDFNFEVFHITQILDKELKNFNLNLGTATYHDPCHLGRHSGIFDEPRNVLKKIGYEIVEMERNREFSACCGAGGGLRAQFPEISKKIALDRVREAKNTGAKVLVTSCPFCVYQFDKVRLNLDVKDVVEEVSNVLLKLNVASI